MTPSGEVPKKWVEQGIGILQWNEGEILEILGLQLLASEEPGKTGGVAQYMGLVVTAGEAKRKTDFLPSEAILPASLSGLSDVLRQCRERAENFLSVSKSALQKVICTDTGECRPEITKALGSGEAACLQELVPIIASALGLPPPFWSIALTVAVLLMKSGLDTFCQQRLS